MKSFFSTRSSLNPTNIMSQEAISNKQLAIDTDYWHCYLSTACLFPCLLSVAHCLFILAPNDTRLRPGIQRIFKIMIFHIQTTLKPLYGGWFIAPLFVYKANLQGGAGGIIFFSLFAQFNSL